MALRNMYNEIKGMKVKELPKYVKPMLSLNYVKRAIGSALDGYHAKVGFQDALIFLRRGYSRHFRYRYNLEYVGNRGPLDWHQRITESGTGLDFELRRAETAFPSLFPRSQSYTLQRLQMALRNFYNEIRGLKVKELPNYVKPMLSVNYVKSTIQRGLDGYHAKYIETDSVEPLLHVCFGGMIFSYLVALPEERRHLEHQQHAKEHGH
ncbi:hypothetical protein CJ030_MR2G028803 [Morella rubra]|uniref:ATP synthase subunit f, mitochondrial n=1 Tax=Morella rubra TaxID=262757 RepID=A0A6A1WEC1_9ROSI|nr:hypothetical protein CJ030_MR2G028803 [Morella rubra]